MKFGALLRTSAEQAPELAGLFDAYKALKKRLKALPAGPGLAGATGSAGTGGEGASARGGGDGDAAPATQADAPSAPAPPPPPAPLPLDPSFAEKEAAFVTELGRDVRQFNDTFIEKEEDAVIRLQALQDAAADALRRADRKRAGSTYAALVDLHGELLMLVHWSMLAYTGLVKILKKHAKRTGARLAVGAGLERLLDQPFCSLEVIQDLVRRTEAEIDALAAFLGGGGGGGAGEGAGPASAAEPGRVTPGPAGTPRASWLVGARSGSAGLAAELAVAAAAAKSGSVGGGGGEGGRGGSSDEESDEDGSDPPSAPRPAADAGAPPPPKRARVETAADGDQPGSAEGGAAAAPARGPPGPPPGPPPTIAVRTAAALGLWSALHATASTPSTVLAPGSAVAGGAGVGSGGPAATDAAAAVPPSGVVGEA